RLNQRAGILEVLRSDGLRGPQRQRGNSTCRIVARVLRESGRPHHKKMRNVPMLQVAVENAVPRVRTHDRTAGVVRRLVWRDVVMSLTGIAPDLPRLHGPGDLLCLAGQ